MLFLEITHGFKLYSPMFLYTGRFFVTGMKKVCIYSDMYFVFRQILVTGMKNSTYVQNCHAFIPLLETGMKNSK